MSKRDGDFWEGLALYWLLHEDLEGKEPEQGTKAREDNDGCLGIIIVLLILFVFAKDHPISIAIVNIGVLYFLWKYGLRLLKWCLKGVLSFVFSNLVGSVVLVLLTKFIGQHNFSFMDYLFIVAAYVGSFLYAYCIICPWITAKAKEIVNRKK